VLNGLNAGELRQMAQDVLENKGTVGVPSLGAIRQDFAAQRNFCKMDFQTGTGGSIDISDEWLASNLVDTSIPQLTKFVADGKVRFNKIAAKALQDAFSEVEKEGLLDRVLSWDGAFVPRLARPNGLPSAHACGIAFDINARWNAFGRPPAERGSMGSVIDLVPIFEKHGFVWGGGGAQAPQMRDSMHFEFAIAKNGTDTFNIQAIDLNEQASFSINDLQAGTGWKNYLMGVIDGFVRRGKKISGVDLVFEKQQAAMAVDGRAIHI